VLDARASREDRRDSRSAGLKTIGCSNPGATVPILSMIHDDPVE
jgi:hypothetical protein